MRYLINSKPDPPVIHDTYTLTENDIKPEHRGEADTAKELEFLVRESFHLCEWCWG